MSSKRKQVSSPFATGGGGVYFETHVQAMFTVLMLTGASAPCLPAGWAIQKLIPQGKVEGFETDDLIVIAKKQGEERQRKLLIQIKHSITVTKHDKTFGNIIVDAWHDFSNPEKFSRKRDQIALITGPLSATDVQHTRRILDWARYSESAEQFFRNIEEPHFASKVKLKKLEAFAHHIKTANDGKEPEKERLFQFMRHFHLLGFDLDVQMGVSSIFLNSLIGQFTQENSYEIWTRVVDEVSSFNKNVGAMTTETLSEELVSLFQKPKPTSHDIPDEFKAVGRLAENEDWLQSEYINDLSKASLFGGWNENNKSDIAVIEQITSEEYQVWIQKIGNFLHFHNPPISVSNGIWKIADRKTAWAELGSRLLDGNLEELASVAKLILRERDPKFEMPKNRRFAAGMHGKVLAHSSSLRQGIAESLALLGNDSNNDLPPLFGPVLMLV